MEEQPHKEEELCVLSTDFADLIKKIAQYVKNDIKTDLITSIGELSISKLNKDEPPLPSEQVTVPENVILLEETEILPPYDLQAKQDSLFEARNMVPNQNVMPQHKTSAAGSHKMDDSAQSKNNSNLPLPEHFNINKIQTNAEVKIAETNFQNEHANVMQTISQHLWLIEDLLQYPHNDNRSLVHQFFEYIQNCLRTYPVLITIFNENPAKPTRLLFANRTDKLKELADIISFNAHWLKSWLSDQFFSETIGLLSKNNETFEDKQFSDTNIGEYSNFVTDLHSTKHPYPLGDVSISPDSGYAEQSNGSIDVIEELLQTLDAVRLRALINQYDRDYDDKLRENVTKILNKPYVVEENTKVQIPVAIQLLDSNKKLACRLDHADDQIITLQKLLTHFNQSMEVTLSNKNTKSSTTMTDANPTTSTGNRWFSPF